MAPSKSLPSYKNETRLLNNGNLDYRSPSEIFDGAPILVYDEVLSTAQFNVPKNYVIEAPERYWVPVSMLNRAISTWQMAIAEADKKLKEETGEDECATWKWVRRVAWSNTNYHVRCREAVLKETTSIGSNEMDDDTSLPSLNEWVYRQVKTAHSAEAKTVCPDSVLNATSTTLDACITAVCEGQREIPIDVLRSVSLM